MNGTYQWIYHVWMKIMCPKQASGRIVGLAYSYSDNYMFWSDISLVNRGIYRATVDSSGNLGQANKTVPDGQCAPAVIALSFSDCSDYFLFATQNKAVWHHSAEVPNCSMHYACLWHMVFPAVSYGCVPCYCWIEDPVCGLSMVWTAGDRDRLNAFLRRCVKLGYRDKSAPYIEDIFGDCDERLFSRINTNSLHILQQYLPERSSLSYSLRPRRHNKTLITKTSELSDRDFIIRNIYKDL